MKKRLIIMLYAVILVLVSSLFASGQRFGWDDLEQFLKKAHRWTGTQTFDDVVILGGTVAGYATSSDLTTHTNPGAFTGVSEFVTPNYTASHSNAGQTIYQINNSSGETSFAIDGKGAVQAGKYAGRTITASEVLTTADFGKTFTINSGSIVYVTLPDVTTANNDSWMRFKKYGAGGFYLRCAGAEESIGDSSVSGGTVYNSSAETFANITLEVTSGVSWSITAFDGTWITP